AAGDARDHPADRQRDDLDAEDDVARERDRDDRAPLLGAADLRGQLPHDPAAARREPLVPDRHDRALDRPVLPRAPLRPRRQPESAGDAAAATSPLPARRAREAARAEPPG